jgi:hypothetical protein
MRSFDWFQGVVVYQVTLMCPFVVLATATLPTE